MKFRVKHCPECKRRTLQVETVIAICYFARTRSQKKKVWFCSSCSKYWEDVSRTHTIEACIYEGTTSL